MTVIKKRLLWPGASQWRIYYHRMWGQLSTTFSNLLKQPNGELLVAVDHNQLRTIASETVSPIDWLHPPSSWAVPPDLQVLKTLKTLKTFIATVCQYNTIQYNVICLQNVYKINFISFLKDCTSKHVGPIVSYKGF